MASFDYVEHDLTFLISEEHLVTLNNATEVLPYIFSFYECCMSLYVVISIVQLNEREASESNAKIRWAYANIGCFDWSRT